MMQIRPIKSKADHRAALREIERLLDARPGTLAGDRLEVLTTLVDHYESQHEPLEAPDPIDLLYHMGAAGSAGEISSPTLAVAPASRRFSTGAER